MFSFIKSVFSMFSFIKSAFSMFFIVGEISFKKNKLKNQKLITNKQYFYKKQKCKINNKIKSKIQNYVITSKIVMSRIQLSKFRTFSYKNSESEEKTENSKEFCKQKPPKTSKFTKSSKTANLNYLRKDSIISQKISLQLMKSILSLKIWKTKKNQRILFIWLSLL